MHEASGIFHDFWRFPVALGATQKDTRMTEKEEVREREREREMGKGETTSPPSRDTKERTVALFNGRIPSVPDTGNVSYFYKLLACRASERANGGRAGPAA